MQEMQPAVLIVDRIEGDIAVCEADADTYLDVPLSTLPAETREGSVLRLAGGAYIIDENEEQERRSRIEQKARKLFVKR